MSEDTYDLEDPASAAAAAVGATRALARHLDEALRRAQAAEGELARSELTLQPEGKRHRLLHFGESPEPDPARGVTLRPAPPKTDAIRWTGENQHEVEWWCRDRGFSCTLVDAHTLRVARGESYVTLTPSGQCWLLVSRDGAGATWPMSTTAGVVDRDYEVVE